MINEFPCRKIFPWCSILRTKRSLRLFNFRRSKFKGSEGRKSTFRFVKVDLHFLPLTCYFLSKTGYPYTNPLHSSPRDPRFFISSPRRQAWMASPWELLGALRLTSRSVDLRNRWFGALDKSTQGRWGNITNLF